MFESKLERLQIELATLDAQGVPKINHILHLVLSLLTGGLWLIVWVAAAMTTQSPTEYVKKKIRLENQIAVLQGR